MTYEETIIIIGNIPIIGDDCYTIAQYQEAKTKGVEALSKQIPKPPHFQGDGYWDGKLVYDTWICPSCDTDYEVGTDAHNYCPNCGQAIDWSEE